MKKEVDPILLVLSADHEIKEIQKFHDAINIGINHAFENQLVIFGVVPSSAETGYGYIKSKTPLSKIITRALRLKNLLKSLIQN